MNFSDGLFEQGVSIGAIHKKMITFIAQQFVNEQFRIGPNLTLRRSKFETLNLSSQKKGGSHSFLSLILMDGWERSKM